MKGFLLLLLTSAPLLSQSAYAQSQPGGTSETGTLITHRPATVYDTDRDSAREATRQFGECMLGTQPGRVAKFIALPVDSPEYHRAIKGVVEDECLSNGELGAPAYLFRAAFIEAMYHREFGARDASDLAKVPPVNYVAGYQAPLSEAASNSIALAFVGDCVVRADPAAARQMINSHPGTSFERQAMANAIPHLPACITRGQTIHFSRPVLRAAVAEGLYRLSMQARATSLQVSH